MDNVEGWALCIILVPHIFDPQKVSFTSYSSGFRLLDRPMSTAARLDQEFVALIARSCAASDVPVPHRFRSRHERLDQIIKLAVTVSNQRVEHPVREFLGSGFG